MKQIIHSLLTSRIGLICTTSLGMLVAGTNAFATNDFLYGGDAGGDYSSAFQLLPYGIASGSGHLTSGSDVEDWWSLDYDVTWTDIVVAFDDLEEGEIILVQLCDSSGNPHHSTETMLSAGGPHYAYLYPGEDDAYIRIVLLDGNSGQYEMSAEYEDE